MEHGAYYVHKQLRTELKNYICSQYFGKTPILLQALSAQLDQEGVLYRKPFLESSPAYQTRPSGMSTAEIPDWMKKFFARLEEAALGVYPAPFCHQIQALEAACAGKDIFVATGTGSGKTECFLWPILAKMAGEARNRPQSWRVRGVRTMILYPMNALVSDQISRLRRLIGDREGRFVNIFRETSGYAARRPQFGMYTGRTPYPGAYPEKAQDRKLEQTLRNISFPQTQQEQEYLRKLSHEGKLPAKADMTAYLARLHESIHTPDEEDAELITRFEMQQVCPDILITNYSMLEYMLLRPIEQGIWDSTKAWLNENAENRLLFVIDEAHMYRGSSGGEVALLIKRLLHKLGIGREKVQFVLTTASMPDSTEEDRAAVMKFAAELTGTPLEKDFFYLTGTREDIPSAPAYEIPFSHFQAFSAAGFEQGDEGQLEMLRQFWMPFGGYLFETVQQAQSWMHENLVRYAPFRELFRLCRGRAISIDELASGIFPGQVEKEAMDAVSVLLALAPLARSEKGAVLFPARMHMLFRGVKGVYACCNEQCSCAHTDGALKLGDIFLNDSYLTCPHCGSAVYELYNDRRCGALFFRGFIHERDMGAASGAYLWRYPGQTLDGMKEIHLFLPEEDYRFPLKQGKFALLPCYLDVKSGFINFRDDLWENQPNVRKLYYSRYQAKGRPQTLTFTTCPHCRHQMSSKQLTSFATRGNQSFGSLIQTQFRLQNPVPGKDNDPERLPNAGRKVLLFSDSRQRAAKLARDMSQSADLAAARQLFVLAIQMMENQTVQYSMNELYDFFCLAAAQRHVQMFHDAQREKFVGDCSAALQSNQRAQKRKREYVPRFSVSNAPAAMQELLLRLFAGGYNTLTDTAICWIEPTDQALFDAVDSLEDAGISASDEEFMEVFNAWLLSICDSAAALGHTVPDAIRQNVRASYGGYGLDPDWNFSRSILDILKEGADEKTITIWRRVLRENFLDSAQPDNGRLYTDLSRLRPRYDPNHTWYRCGQCAEITPYLLRGRCPSCGAQKISAMRSGDFEALEFWRKPIEEALRGEPVRIIDTQEHTAQLSHKDQRDDLWSKTEQYELRFQDLIQEGQTPVDILSSTTTMEVGIDIGSLVAVGMRNIPPMRENYQQRAGRAGRRGAALSTIVTFCEDGPHDMLYYNEPVPMFRGDARRPWIDIASEKLLQRHLGIVAMQEFLATQGESMDHIAAAMFLDRCIEPYLQFLQKKPSSWYQMLLPKETDTDTARFLAAQAQGMEKLRQKRVMHPELFGWEEGAENKNAKTLLDALYEEGLIPTYSFPKNVVSTYITDTNGIVRFEVSRGLDVAISEYAPGRAIVVDKQTYQIGGLFSPDSVRRRGKAVAPARAYLEDPNYCKTLLQCDSCQWFGVERDGMTLCPSCGSKLRRRARQMIKPWGFAPKDGQQIQQAQLEEAYSFSKPPQYATVADAQSTKSVPDWKHLRMAQRTNQQLIMRNDGPGDLGFTICSDCGAAMSGEGQDVLKNVDRPYRLGFVKSKCRHMNTLQVDLGYDFLTDMLVLEFAVDRTKISSFTESMWIARAAQSLAEALRLTASKELDIEFTELVTGYRVRHGETEDFIDVYLYDSLSSGAGYAAAIGAQIEAVLQKTQMQLQRCTCASACYNCLKHYRNQMVHGQLDRFAALELLHWGKNGVLAPPVSTEKQVEYVRPLEKVLLHAGIELLVDGGMLRIRKKNHEKQLVVYPAMWACSTAPDIVYLSDAQIRFAKPYAASVLMDSL